MKARAIHFGLVLAGLGLLGACGGTTTEVVPDGAEASPDDGTWPSHLVTSAGTGPALYLSEGADSPAIGYISEGVGVRIGRPPEGDRIYVMVDGPIKIRGWLPIARLAARVQQRGRVRGTPTSVAANDLVGVRGTAGEGLMRVEVRPWLGQANAPSLGPFIGEYPTDRLGADEVVGADAAAGERGEARSLPPGQEVPVYAAPGEDVVATLPAVDPPLVVELVQSRGEWSAVRVGTGPTVVGYVNVPLGPADALPVRPAPETAVPGAVPSRLAAEETRPLWRVPAGTRLRFDDKVIAVFEAEGYAREMNRYDTGEIDVFVAVDEDVAIRGMVREEDLVEIEGQSGTSPPTAAPATTPAANPAPAPTPGGLAPAGASAGAPGTAAPSAP